MDENQRKEEVKDKICNYLKEGAFKRDAALMAGIDESTLYRWIEADASFASRVEASILEYKHSLITNMTIASVKDGRLALEVLRRRFPKEWKINANLEDYEHNNDIKKLIETFEKIIFANEVEDRDKAKLLSIKANPQ